ncbi:RagB/SusD family nutrient uptake outer membrane protein [Bacteroides sp. OttesenSCG-928-N06]|nr:RagB/SusD family nutrient uptake outer membrane protein [Bacteroides sp. OttesenSCG-928-N06]
MKIYRLINRASKALLITGVIALSGCSEDFLKPDPLSFYEPEKTFTTISGLESVQATADRHLRTYWSYYNRADLSLPISSEYMMSDLMVAAKTDDGNIFADIATRLTPTNGFHNDNINRLNYFWYETYTGIKSANTILSYIDNVPMDDKTRKEFMGRAYFHRSFRYLALCFQFKNVPLITKILQVPKLNYKSTKREAILEMITKDMENAVDWVPEQSEMKYIGMINKGACRQLLIKCYLAKGDWDNAIKQADILINQSGYELMTNTFGNFINPYPETWNITRNVIWDLHRPENKSIKANKEVILSMPNLPNTTSAVAFNAMRNWLPFWSGSMIKAPDTKTAVMIYQQTNGNYRSEHDYSRALGRGIAHVRPTHFATHSLWCVNGVNDATDLRHNTEVGNWVTMESLKYNNPACKNFGENLRLYDDNGKVLCTDTIRCWFDWPHYKYYYEDDVQTANPAHTNHTGGAGDLYCYRLAETYLLRAEAKFYKGDIAGATADVNKIRERAQCTEMYDAVTIGDIVNERARELHMEEWRWTELSRISYSLALSGKADEWGNTYTVDKLSESSYWFNRIEKYNNYYNKGAEAKGRKYTMAPHNIYMPIPQGQIDKNRDGELAQNPGYNDHNPATPMWETWEEAVADEDIIN